MTAAKSFVKSADTPVPVARSKAEVERILKRYGASGFATSEDYAIGKVSITFVVPDSPKADAVKVGVKLPIEILRVYQILFPLDRWGSRRTATLAVARSDPKGWAQAERVAWRNLVLWIDAALSSAACGLQTVTESLFAHAITGAQGERMIEVIEQAQHALGDGVRRLLTAEAQS